MSEQVPAEAEYGILARERARVAEIWPSPGVTEERDRIVALLGDEATVDEIWHRVGEVLPWPGASEQEVRAVLAALRVLIAGDSKGGAL